MNAVKYAQSRYVTIRELEERPGLPSQIMREIEASLIGELARSVALSGHQFDGWPKVTVEGDRDKFSHHPVMRVVAEVATT